MTQAVITAAHKLGIYLALTVVVITPRSEVTPFTMVHLQV
jgi:hypothetical protein